MADVKKENPTTPAPTVDKEVPKTDKVEDAPKADSSDESKMYDAYVRGTSIQDIATEFKVGTQEVLEAVEKIEQDR